ncbi:hypothetical protein B0H21DRAFT_154325 [Amylocystis lapponica]|nr:hypothetical protein B0H21DRAFT_154325 [Amylocystis lapponica]
MRRYDFATTCSVDTQVTSRVVLGLPTIALAGLTAVPFSQRLREVLLASPLFYHARLRASPGAFTHPRSHGLPDVPDSLNTLASDRSSHPPFASRLPPSACPEPHRTCPPRVRPSPRVSSPAHAPTLIRASAPCLLSFCTFAEPDRPRARTCSCPRYRIAARYRSSIAGLRASEPHRSPARVVGATRMAVAVSKRLPSYATMPVIVRLRVD